MHAGLCFAALTFLCFFCYDIPMEWSTGRRFFYGAAIFATLGLLLAYPIYFFVHEEPTCFDAKRNGDETGIDCGGGCALYCKADVQPLRVVWAEAFQLTPGHYDIGAYVENLNRTAGIKVLRYTFEIQDTENKELAVRSGTIEVPPQGRLLLFEGDLSLDREPGRVTIHFNEHDLERWTQAQPGRSEVITKNQTLKDVASKPRFEVTLLNTDLVNDASSLLVGAVIYGPGRRPIGISRTYVDGMAKGGEEKIFFTWPSSFPAPSGALGCDSSDHSSASGSSCDASGLLTEIIITPQAIFVE